MVKGYGYWYGYWCECECDRENGGIGIGWRPTLSVTLAKDVGKSTENTIRITSDSG